MIPSQVRFGKVANRSIQCWALFRMNNHMTRSCIMFEKKKMRKKKKKRLNGNVLNNVNLSIKLISSEHRALCKNLLFRSLVDYRRILSEAPGRINLLANESYG